VILRAVTPDCVLNKPREITRVSWIELLGIHMTGESLDRRGATALRIASCPEFMPVAEDQYQASPMQEIMHQSIDRD
jgi:hypothetical protein